MAKKTEEIDYNAEIAKLQKARDAKSVEAKKKDDKAFAIRAERIKASEKKAEGIRQARVALIKSMTKVVAGAQKTIQLNGGGVKEKALLDAIIAYTKPAAVKKVTPKQED